MPWLAPLRVVGPQASQLVLLIGGDGSNLADWVNGWLATQEAQGWAAAPLRALYEHWILMRGDGQKSSISASFGAWMISSVSCHHPSATFCLCSHPSVFWPAQAMSRPGRCPRA